MENKKLLYNFWGYLSDKIGISSPCGNATYTIWILGEFIKRGWEVYCVVDRDKDIVGEYGIDAFAAFSKNKRWEIYKKIKFIGISNLPKLNELGIDLIINEWRFKTKDNSKEFGDPTRTPDLDIQNLITAYAYVHNTPLVIFDLDYKLTPEEEKEIHPHKVIETSLKPKPNHTSVYIPMDFSEMKQFGINIPKASVKLTFVGNDYEKREDIENKIISFANKYGGVHFYGNWLKEDKKELRARWNKVEFHDRIGFSEFRDVIGNSIACPLLAKEEYKERGFMTARLLEILLFGSIPIGFSDFHGINRFLPPQLIVDMKNYEVSMEKVWKFIYGLGFSKRNELRKKLIDDLRFMSVKFFVDEVLK